MYDYIVVGAGSAGCVLAARLSEDPSVKVLLVEAGPPDTLDNIHVPLGVASIARSAVDWDMWTGHEPHCDGRRVYLPRGRTLGGSSSTNAMVYIRGARADYDSWRDEFGCQGWGYDDLLPYFKRAEDNERGESDYHGAGGPLAVSEGRHRNPMMDAVVEAGVQAGLPANDDFNGPDQLGMGHYQVTQRDGRRCSASVAYLHPSLSRPNLAVECGVQVERVLFDGTRAVGISGRRIGEVVEWNCEREVIVSAGAYQSPQLLMLSGIGPAQHLISRLIMPVADRPMVGKNLQDHVQLWAMWRSNEPVSLADAMAPQNVEANVALFETAGKGPLTSNMAEVGGFAKTSPDLDAPDLQIHAIPGILSEDPAFLMPEHGLSIGACLLTPRSRGEVYLATPEPSAKPHIMHNYFADPDDLRRMEAGVALVMEISRQAALEPYCAAPEQVPQSGAKADVDAFIRRHAQTLYHPVGTCAMGASDDAVLDTELRVRGVEGLRVCDASVMPTVPRGNTNAPTIAIAERASDLIRGVQPLQAQAPARATA